MKFEWLLTFWGTTMRKTARQRFLIFIRDYLVRHTLSTTCQPFPTHHAPELSTPVFGNLRSAHELPKKQTPALPKRMYVPSKRKRWISVAVLFTICCTANIYWSIGHPSITEASHNRWFQPQWREISRDVSTRSARAQRQFQNCVVWWQWQDRPPYKHLITYLFRYNRWNLKEWSVINAEIFSFAQHYCQYDAFGD